MAYKEHKFNNKAEIQAMYDALGSMPEAKSTKGRKPGTVKKKTGAKPAKKK